MKKILCIGLFLLSTIIKAQDFNVDGINYNITNSNQVEVVSATPNNNIILPEKVNYKGRTYNITQIGDKAFENCNTLKTINLDNISSIGYNAFKNCKNLKHIIFNKLQYIDRGAFEGCYLKSIKINSKNPPEFDSKAFSFLSYITTTLIIPVKTRNIYKNTNWNKFSNIMETNKCILNINFNQHGKVLYNGIPISPNSVELNVNNTIELYIQPNTDYKLAYVLSDSIDVTKSIKNNIYKFTIKNPITNIDIKFQAYNLQLNDGVKYDLTEGFTYDTVSYTRYFNNTNWQALYIPFEMNYNEWCNDFTIARINDTRQYDDNNDGVIDRTILEAFILPAGSTIDANTPYLIRANNTGEKIIKFYNKFVHKAESNKFDCTSWTYRYLFTGTYEGVNGNEMYNNKYYAMVAGKLKYATKPIPLKPYRWYLTIQDRNGSQVYNTQKINLNFLDEFGNITAIEDLDSNNDNIIYDLNGRCATKSTKGIYIINGKKIYIK